MNKKTVMELKELCRKKNISGFSKLNKNDLINILQKKKINKKKMKGGYDEELVRKINAGEDVNLINADLQGAPLYYKNLQGAQLQGAKLQGALLQGAQLQGAQLQGAKLQGAHLEGAHLEGANLEGAQLQGAHLKGIFYDEYTIFPETFRTLLKGKLNAPPLMRTNYYPNNNTNNTNNTNNNTNNN
jgi:hypothetical protein